MNILVTLMVILEVITALLLIAVILMQQSKGQGGLGTAFGGGMGESMFGSRAGNVLTKTTIVLSTIFLLNTTFLAIAFSRRHDDSIIDERAMVPTQQPMAPAQQPAAPPPQRMISDAPAPAAQPVAVPSDPSTIVVDEVAPIQVSPPEAVSVDLDPVVVEE